MRQTGTVEELGPHAPLVAIRMHKQRAFSVIEIINRNDVSVGDQMSWDGEAREGLAVYTNDTRGWVDEVFVRFPLLWNDHYRGALHSKR